MGLLRPLKRLVLIGRRGLLVLFIIMHPGMNEPDGCSDHINMDAPDKEADADHQTGILITEVIKIDKRQHYADG